MPVYRGPDGEIIEVKKGELLDTKKPTERDQKQPTRDGDGERGHGAARLDAPTRKLVEKPAPSVADSDGKTRIIGGRVKREDSTAKDERDEPDDDMNDPIVGWLVVVEGPGKGRAVTLGYGSNSLGRGKNDRVKLDFGDDRISRGGHATVTYDPHGRKYYLQHGGGKNLTYLEGQPVLIPTELPALGHITLGATVLRFIALCGEAFDWQDTE